MLARTSAGETPSASRSASHSARHCFFSLVHLHLVDRVQAPGAAVGAEALRRAVAEDEHQQPVVVADPCADDVAIGIDRDLDAVQRAVHRHVLDPAHAVVERGLPRGGELRALRVAAQLVGADLAAADRAGGGPDAAGVGQRLDEGALDFGLPAVVAVALAGDGGEGGEGGASFGGLRMSGGWFGGVGHGGGSVFGSVFADI